MAKKPVTIEVWSDIACPWCYIGIRQLETALKEHDQQARKSGTDVPEINVEYRSFELIPDAPTDFPMAYLERQNGMSVPQMREYAKNVYARGQDAGLDLRFDDVQHTNTALAHQALHFAKEHGKQRELKERLMAAHFTEGRHVGRIEELADLGAEVGLDREELASALAAEKYLPAVRADESAAARMGVPAVPTFLGDNKHVLSGAATNADFRRLIDQVTSESV